MGGDDGKTTGKGFQEDVVGGGGGREVEKGVRGLVGEEEFVVRDAAAIGDVGKAVEGGLFGSGADDVEEDIGAILEGQSGGVESGEVATSGANGEQA